MSGTLLRARVVWLVSEPPLDNAGVYIRDGLIRDFGPWAELERRWSGAAVEDLGAVVLMPGLVNAHCHLDYTGMVGMIPAPSSSANFPDWIKSILSLKSHWSYTEYAASWVKGARQLVASGCMSVWDIEAVPELLPEAWQSTPMRVTSFLEMTGVKSGDRAEQVLAVAERNVARLLKREFQEASLSPHAPYSTPPRLMELVAAKMRAENMRVCVHLAESEAEFEMFQNRRGAMFDWLKTQRKMDDCGGRSPVQQAEQLGLLNENLIAVHCNYLAPGDVELLAKGKVTVVHCPRSHAYFRHARFPYEELAAASVNVVLGTDSLASVQSDSKRPATLDMWEEMRLFARNYPATAPETIFKMATAGAGRKADLISIPFTGGTEKTAESLLAGPIKIADRWIAGKRVDIN